MNTLIRAGEAIRGGDKFSPLLPNVFIIKKLSFCGTSEACAKTKWAVIYEPNGIFTPYSEIRSSFSVGNDNSVFCKCCGLLTVTWRVTVMWSQTVNWLGTTSSRSINLESYLFMYVYVYVCLPFQGTMAMRVTCSLCFGEIFCCGRARAQINLESCQARKKPIR